MTEELELFSEDAEEQLQYMENALVEAQEDGEASEDGIGAIFRAMHTLKGTAGMFGFDEVVEFAHIGENLLDEVRTGNVTIDAPMIDIFLRSKDHLQTLVDLSLNEEVMEQSVTDVHVQLIDELLSCMPGAKAEPVATVEQEDSLLEEEDSDGHQTWHISLRIDKAFFHSGMDLMSLFDFFNKLGALVVNIPYTKKVPKIEKINPMDAYIGFEIDFYTAISYDEIIEIFEFVEDDVSLKVFKHRDLKGLSELLDSDLSLAKLLADEGVFTDQHLQDALNYTDNTEEPIVHKEEVKKTVVEVKKVRETPVKTTPEVVKPKAKEKTKTSSLRVDSVKIDQLINQISEMVIANAKIMQIASDKDDTELSEAASVMSDMLEEVRSSVMDVRMVQVQDSFTKYKRIVNDVAKKLGKEIDFVITGGETELDKTVVEKISDPLMHMLRNSIDHGVEMPDERIASGKPAKGKVALRAYPDAGTIVLEIEDDGKGLNKEFLFNKAVSKGIIEPDAQLSDKQIYDLIFAAGFSTADVVSDISGRGVGMDVVRRNIEDLRGMIEIDSEIGRGTKFTIRLPLTLAIIDGFLIQAGNTKYVIPLDMIKECMELNFNLKEQMKGNQFINLRGDILPLLDIRHYFNEEISEDIRENVVVVGYGDYSIGLQVDELYGEHQTVIKPLGEVFSNVPGISGGSILGSGEVALIFDIPALIDYKILHVN